MPTPAINSIVYTPQAFAVPGEDHTATLDRFFDFAASNASRDYMLAVLGQWDLTSPLVIEGVSRPMFWNATFNDRVGMDDVVTIKKCREAEWPGIMRVNGNRAGTAALSMGRDTVNCVRLEDSRAANLPTFNTRGSSGWGVYHGAGNSNMISVGNVLSRENGCSARSDRQHHVEVVKFTNKESNNMHQRTHLHLKHGATLPSEAHQLTRALMIIEGEPYKITGVDRKAGIVTVYPRVPDQHQVPGKVGMVYGGGLCMDAGGYTAKGRFGMVSPTRCGVGLWLTGYDTPTGVGITSQYNGVGLVLGNDPDNAFGGTNLQSVYFESEPVCDVIQIAQTSAQNGSIFGAPTSLGLNRIKNLVWLDKNGGKGKRKNSLPITMPHKGVLLTPASNRDVIRSANDDESSYTAYSSPTPDSETYAYLRRGSSQLYLSDNKELREIRGTAPIRFDVYGNAEGGQYRGAFKIKCQEGYTINHKGGTVVLNRMPAAYTIHALLEDGNNWIVSITEHQVPG